MRRAALVAAYLFPSALLLHSALWYLVPFLFPLVTAAVVALLGLAAYVLLAWSWFKRQRTRVAAAAVLVTSTWLIWVLAPTRELGVYARFAVMRGEYETVVAEVSKGGNPSCLRDHRCEIDGLTSPYVVFPWPGFLSGWLGVVHVAESGILTPDLDRLKTFAASASCDPRPMASQYFICVFY